MNGSRETITMMYQLAATGRSASLMSIKDDGKILSKPIDDLIMFEHDRYDRYLLSNGVIVTHMCYADDDHLWEVYRMVDQPFFSHDNKLVLYKPLMLWFFYPRTVGKPLLNMTCQLLN